MALLARIQQTSVIGSMNAASMTPVVRVPVLSEQKVETP